jgi:hypothetical protein
MGSQRFLGEEGGLFCARTSEGLSWPFPIMLRGHVANAATALAAAPAKIRESTNDILRTRFSGVPSSGAPRSDEFWPYMPQRESAPQAIVPAPPAPPARLELWRQVPQMIPIMTLRLHERRGRRLVFASGRRKAREGWR